MKQLMTLKCELVKKIEKEINDYEFNINEKSPCWLVLAKKAKFEFMQRVSLEIADFHFSKAELKAILEVDNFSNLCWTVWVEFEKSIPETIEFVAEFLTQEIDNALFRA